MASAAEQTRRVSNSRPFELLARAGFIVTGLLHLVIGAIAWHIAVGGSGEADQSGAIGGLARQPLGEALVWAGFVGCVALTLWQISEAVFQGPSTDPRVRPKNRLIAVGRAIVFAAIAVSLAQFVIGAPKDSGEATSDFSATLMQSGAGSILLVAIGAGIICMGGYCVFKGVSRNFLKDLKTTGPHHIGKATVPLGITGYTAKGVALAAVGLLFIVATVQSDPQEATGLDGALKALGEQPFGPFILGFVGVGLICFGVYSIARAKFANM